MNPILDFIINQIFGQGAIFISLIALVGLILQKKDFSEIVRGTFMTAIGYFVLNQGSSMIQGAVVDVGNAFSKLMNSPALGDSVDIGGQYGTQIGLVMIIGFAINLVVARFTKFKTVFLTGHMLYWFPYVFVAAGVDAGLSGIVLVLFAGLFTAIYMVVAPNLMYPLVKKVTGDDSFSVAHPTTPLSLVGAWVAKVTGDPKKSTEDLKFPKALNFCREVSIICSIVILLTYIVMALLLGGSAEEVLFQGTKPFVYFFNKTMTFGGGVTVILLGQELCNVHAKPQQSPVQHEQRQEKHQHCRDLADHDFRFAAGKIDGCAGGQHQRYCSEGKQQHRSRTGEKAACGKGIDLHGLQRTARHQPV